MDFTEEQIDSTIERASGIYDEHSYQGRKLKVLKDLRDKWNNPLTEPQMRYLRNLMNNFSDENLTKAENWAEEWRTNKELRERADVISKYSIAQRHSVKSKLSSFLQS